MKTIVYQQNLNYLSELKEYNVDFIMLADEDFSSCPKGLKKEELLVNISEVKKAGFEVVIKVDRLYQQSEINGLTDYLKQLNEAGCDAVLYSDVAVGQICIDEKLNMKTIYAPETLLTNKYDVEALRDYGIDYSVISKDIIVSDVYDIVKHNPGFCFLRVFGPILIAYSARKFISNYLLDGQIHNEGYWLKEESRDIVLPMVEKSSGSWLYGYTLETINDIKEISNSEFAGVIIDPIIHDDYMAVEFAKVYYQLINNEINEAEAYKLTEKYSDVQFTSLSEIKKTSLDKE